MRILLINKYIYRKGGSETYTLELGNILEDNGHQVFYWGLDDPKNGEVKVTSPFRVKGLTEAKSSFNKTKLFLSSIYSLNAQNSIKHVLEETTPDIVHINNFHGQFSISIIDEIKKSNIPIVHTVHDYRLICPRSSLYNSKKGEICTKCKNGKFVNCLLTKCIKDSYIHSLRGTLEAMLSTNMFSSYNKIDRFIFVSQFQKRKFEEMGFYSDKSICIPNFVANNFCNIDENISKREYGLYFGNFLKEKGLFTIVEAYKELKEHDLFLVGKGEDIDNLVLPSNIKNLGFKKGNDIVKIVREAKFVIVGSEWFEPFGLTTVEALSCGTPVIGSDCGATIEIINDGINGMLFKSGDVNDLVSKIRLIYEDSEYAKELSKNALKSSKKFNSQRYYKELINVYHDLI